MTIAEAPQMANENDSLIEAMQGMLHRAPEPAGLEPGEVINNAGTNEELPVNMIASSVSSAGYCYVWDRVSGQRSTVNLNMLPAQLKKRHPDGSLVFTHRKPDIEPVRGTLPCLLHPSNPERKQYDRWGLRTCPKATLASPYDVEQHMARCHKREWATIQRERAEVDKKKELARQEQHQKELVAALAGRIAAGESVEPRTRGRKHAEEA